MLNFWGDRGEQCAVRRFVRLREVGQTAVMHTMAKLILLYPMGKTLSGAFPSDVKHGNKGLCKQFGTYRALLPEVCYTCVYSTVWVVA